MSLQEFMSVTGCQEFVSGTCQIKYEPMGHRKPRQPIRDDNHGPGPRAWSVKTVAKQYWDEVFYACKFAGLMGRIFARLEVPAIMIRAPVMMIRAPGMTTPASAMTIRDLVVF
ncbi:hypothetical protein F2Q69_00048549 [Brassica cretica]|uniref:Uncharacterized protein n=1 Tax=Brassica cretica TaxID=69181 RepID=A0A8S9Q4G6_BRACR|nr:hypothetical protein F2Q69_00048549 [Brassica cretica]